MDLRKLAIDTDREVAGVWVEIGEGAKLKIARMNNPEYNKLFTRLSRPFAQLAKSGALPEYHAKKIVAETLSKTILLDWQGLALDGQEITYSQHEACKILQNPEFQSFFTLVVQFAENEANFRQEEIKTELGE